MDREDAIRRRLEGVLRPGDRITAQSDEADGRVEVRLDRSRSELATTHPELYGALRGANEAISGRGGCGSIIGWVLAGGALAYSAERGWLPIGLAGEVDPALAALAMLGAGWLGSAVGRLRRHLAYLRRREELWGAIDRSRLSGERLIAEISEDGELRALVRHLARDPGRSRREL